MKLPVVSTIVCKDSERVFQFLTDPKYFNIYPSAPGFKLLGIDHLNSLPYGLGKKLRIKISRHNQEINADLEVYKFVPPSELGYKLINAFSAKTRKNDERLKGLLPVFAFDIILEDMSNKTKLKYITHVTNVNSMFIRVMMYIVFGVFGYYRNKAYVKDLGGLIERYV